MRKSKTIPLHARDGSVRAYAIVDADDFDELSKERWSLHNRGYAWQCRKGVALFMHRKLLGLTHADLRKGDHINRNRLDNRKENLRVATTPQNARNRSINNTHRSSRYQGVRRHKSGGWEARIGNAGRIYVGYFNTEDAAGVAAEAARRHEFPEAFGAGA